MNKNPTTLLFCSLLFFFSCLRHAVAGPDQALPSTDTLPVQAVNITPEHVSSENSGDLNINLTNKTDIEKQFIQAIYQRGERDGDILLTTIDRVSASLRELGGLVTELHRTSDESIIQPVAVKDFLDRVRSYRQESTLFLEEINNLKYFPTLRPDIVADADHQVDMLPLVEHYELALQKLESQVEQLHFTILLPNGIFHQQVGIGSDQLKGMSLYSAEQIADMKRNIMQLRAVRTQDKRVIDEGINQFTKTAIETFIDTFGSSERFRTMSDQQGHQNAKEMLIDAFWARSYIRATYGIQIGCIPVEYDKQIFNLDYYLNDMTVGAAPVYDQNKLMRYANLAQEAMLTVASSASKKWSSVNSWVSWIAGKSNEMDTKYFIIALMKRDIDEELALSRSGGLKKVRDNYRQHYLGSDLWRTLYLEKARQVFHSGGDDDDDIEDDVMVVEAGTLKGSVAMCINALENQENRLDEARKLQSVVDLLTKDNNVAEKRKKRQLFK